MYWAVDYSVSLIRFIGLTPTLRCLSGKVHPAPDTVIQGIWLEDSKSLFQPLLRGGVLLIVLKKFDVLIT